MNVWGKRSMIKKQRNENNRMYKSGCKDTTHNFSHTIALELTWERNRLMPGISCQLLNTEQAMETVRPVKQISTKSTFLC
jgi:ribosomal protein S20